MQNAPRNEIDLLTRPYFHGRTISNLRHDSHKSQLLRDMHFRATIVGYNKIYQIMNKRYASLGIAITLLLTSPVLVSAQSISTGNGSLLAILEQLVATLTQELGALINAQINPSASMNASVPSTNPTVPSGSDTQSTSQGTATATIDPSSLTTGSASPIITGAFHSSSLLDGPAVVVSSQSLPSVIPSGSSVSGVVWNDATDHNGGVSLVSDKYSDTVIPPPNGALPAGTYYVGIYNKEGPLSPVNLQNPQYTETLLASGILTVTGSANKTTDAPLITSIVPSSGPPYTSVTLVGTGFGPNDTINFDGHPLLTPANLKYGAVSYSQAAGTLTFFIPDSMGCGSQYDFASQCVYMGIQPRLHSVSVTNPAGQTSASNPPIPFTVTAGPSASIDQSSLTSASNSSAATITGTATDESQINVTIQGNPLATAPVVDGRWSATLPLLIPGTYPLDIQPANESTIILTTGTLIVQ